MRYESHIDRVNPHTTVRLPSKTLAQTDEKVVDLAVIGSTFGALPGGAAVVCLAHDCLVEDPGNSEGLVRTEALHSAASAFIILRRSIRAEIGRGDGGLRPEEKLQVDVDQGSTQPEASGEGHRQETSMSAGRPDTTAGSGDAMVPASPNLGESPSDMASTSHAAAIAAVARMEVAVELPVYGDELCADLAAIVSSPSYSSSFADGDSLHKSQIRRVRQVVEKHSVLLSPQARCAVTALLAGKGETWTDDATADGDHRKEGDISPLRDPAFWKAALSDALLAVRTASLEHLVLWAGACHPEKLHSACISEASASVESGSAPAVDGGVVEVGARAMPTAAAGSYDGGKQVGGGDEIEAVWAALHKASCLGLSPLMMLAITLSHEDPCPDETLLSPSRTSQSPVNTVEHRSGNVGTTVASFTKSAVRSALRLLSPISLHNISRCLSSQRHSCSDRAQTAAAALSPARAESAAAENSDSSMMVEASSKREVEKTEILAGLPEHPAIGDLSCLDKETLKRGVEGVVAALDARGTGSLPPSALAVALQSGEAGLRLEPLQARMVLRLAGETHPSPTLSI